jgi:RimJ/RimL family protein N-acetyltransferase
VADVDDVPVQSSRPAGRAAAPSFETARLTLRRWQEADRESFAAINADAEVMRYFRAPLDRAGSDAMIDRIETSFDALGYGLWAVEIRESGRFIGFTGLARQTYAAHFTPAVEVGWRLERSSWGDGYAAAVIGPLAPAGAAGS